MSRFAKLKPSKTVTVGIACTVVLVVAVTLFTLWSQGRTLPPTDLVQTPSTETSAPLPEPTAEPVKESPAPGFMTWEDAIDYCDEFESENPYCHDLHYGPTKAEAMGSMVSSFCFSMYLYNQGGHVSTFKLEQRPEGLVIVDDLLTARLRDFAGFYAQAKQRGQLPESAPIDAAEALVQYDDANGYCQIFRR